MPKLQRGFTLMELMIAVAIVGILAAIALPSYEEFVKKGRRSDAMTSLLKVQLEQEKWRSNNPKYATLAELADAGVSATSSEGFYTISVSNNTATAYQALATPTGSQASDSCGKFALNQSGPYFGTGYADATCWGR